MVEPNQLTTASRGPSGIMAPRHRSESNRYLQVRLKLSKKTVTAPFALNVM
jgi:hypothetical protein